MIYNIKPYIFKTVPFKNYEYVYDPSKYWMRSYNSYKFFDEEKGMFTLRIKF